MSVAGNLAIPLARNLARGIAENPGGNGADVDNLLVDDNLDAYLIDDTNTDQHLLNSPVGFAAEAGFSISGEIADGNSIIITGTSFGTKPNGVGPMFYFELGLNNGSPGTGSRGTYTDGWNNSFTQTVVAPNRTHALEMLLEASPSKNMNVSQIDVGSTKTDLYMMARVHINADGDDLFADDTAYNQKPFRYSQASPSNNIVWPSVGAQDRADGNPRLASEFVGEGTHFFNADGVAIRDVFGLRKNEWVTDECEYHQGDVDVSEGTIKLIRNGVIHTHSPNGGANFVTRTAAFPNLMHNFVLWQDQKSEGAQFSVRADFLYLDDSFARIIISEEATWEAATASPEVFFVREVQIPTAWANLEITFTIRQGIHTLLAGKYLYVVDSAGIDQKIGQFT